ncbi:MAG: hypothetical protein NPINA01_12140 [Nitrospinaceae bacterium]|nr:MAG: hypothetical protein NPINA01_12140 [Nitrospinaceae bacterium]
MEKKLKITAVCGWALPPQWFKEQIERAFPGTHVNVFYPSLPGDVLEAGDLLGESKADLYIGYSLGSLWLMTHQEMLPKESTKAVLAPILAFTRERNRGGKTPETQLKYLGKQLQRNPKDVSPLLKFYADCGIHFPESRIKEVPETGILLNGLEFLQSAPIPEQGLDKFIALIGENDPLLDGIQLKPHLPKLEIVRDAGHAPGQLLNHLAQVSSL